MQNYTLEQDVVIPMRDGVRLATDIHLPDGPGPWPVVLERRKLKVVNRRSSTMAPAARPPIIAGSPNWPTTAVSVMPSSGVVM